MIKLLCSCYVQGLLLLNKFFKYLYFLMIGIIFQEEDSDDEHFVDEIDDEDLQQVNGKGDDDDEGGSVDNDRPNISGKQSSWVHRSNTNCNYLYFANN